MDIWIILIFINKSECSYSTSYNSILQENNTLLRKNCLYWNDQQNSCQCVCQVVIKVDDKYVTAKEKRSCEKKRETNHLSTAMIVKGIALMKRFNLQNS